ncbi:hypothetical protein VB734_13840 [Synechococcus sp. BA-124 BA4]|jgi:hypothetical protein|uniref:hypothetical protein n=1 Tax=unclassified Synechococcus TaxID=2626047 RepID=UPI0018CF91D6|nr:MULTISPECIES: hypothetical protein [unclassified Synechococcus]MEA5401118.1 hypothetical protein [Synechococcus sp. BA-124 BA4]QPN55339.1 hypothetical protein I1E95_08765 [Synechococcus sp. CBW1107]
MKNATERSASSSEAGLLTLMRRYRRAQRLVVDYAIGLGILGLAPKLLTPILIIAAALLLTMIWHVGRCWQFAIVINPITIGGEVLNVLGALVVAVLTWLILVVLGVSIPLVDHFSLSGALMSGTWTFGAAVNQFFFLGFIRKYSHEYVVGGHE